MYPRVFDFLTGHPRGLERDDQGGDAVRAFASGSYGSSAIIRENSIGDPFFGSVDNINISAALCCGSDPRDIGPSCSSVQLIFAHVTLEARDLTVRLRHSQAKSNIAFQHIREESSLLLFVTEVNHWWATNGISASQSPDYTKISASSQLVDDDNVVKLIPVLGIDIPGQSLAIQVVCRKWERTDSSVSQFCVSFVNLSATSSSAGNCFLEI